MKHNFDFSGGPALWSQTEDVDYFPTLLLSSTLPDQVSDVTTSTEKRKRRKKDPDPDWSPSEEELSQDKTVETKGTAISLHFDKPKI